MTLTWDDSPQGTSAWRDARLGCLTSTGADVVLGLAALRGDKGRDTLKGRETYIRQRVAERLTGQCAFEEDFTTKAMEWGTQQEGAARAAYEAATGRQLSVAGFARVDGLWLGTSPDGLVYTMDGFVERVVEFKAPASATHLEYWELAKGGQVPDAYVRQCVHHLWVLGCEVLDFASYDPRMPPPMQLVVVELTRASVSAMLDRYAEAAMRLLGDMDALEGRLREAA